MKARVFITLKPGVLDPQGRAIHNALEGLGFDGVKGVRAGKLIELDLADGTSDADIEADVPQIARQYGHREFPHRAAWRQFEHRRHRLSRSNCDRDVAVALEQVTAARRRWSGTARRASARHRLHRSAQGGFSYGDYLRSGAMAARAPIMRAVGDAAGRGVPVIGICNGFQVLTEAGLLPGALMRNAGLSFVCRPVALTVENSQSLFTAAYQAGETIELPVAHHDGNYQADEATLDRLEGEGRVALRYAEGVNGSARSIAGILNDAAMCSG
jgi:phosphoribosylformylglycinamidine synthase